MDDRYFLYFVREDPEDDSGIAVVARSYGDAKCIAMGEFLTPDFTDLRANKKGEAPRCMERGIIQDEFYALQLGVYGYLQDCRCPGCGKVGYVEMYRPEGEDVYGCGDCKGGFGPKEATR